MDIDALILAYISINESLEPYTEHKLHEVKNQARIQIDRNNRSIRELKSEKKYFQS